MRAIPMLLAVALAVSSAAIAFPMEQATPNIPTNINGSSQSAYSASAITAAAPAATFQPESDEKQVIAEVAGRKITIADLEQKKIGTLLQGRSQYYQQERKALEQLIEDELLAIQAEKAKMTVDEFLQKEVYKDIKEPKEDQLRSFMKGRTPKSPLQPSMARSWITFTSYVVTGRARPISLLCEPRQRCVFC